VGRWTRTRSQSTLVDPAVHLCALLLELVDPGLHVGELVLELLNLLRVGVDGLVERSGQQVGHWLWLSHGGAAVVHGGGHGAVAVGEAPGGKLCLLRLLGARVHVGLFDGRRGLLQLRVFAAGLGALLGVVVEGLRAGGGFVFDVAVGTRALDGSVALCEWGRRAAHAFEEHYGGKRATSARGRGRDYMAQREKRNCTARRRLGLGERVYL
jgi:hypothetical protein